MVASTENRVGVAGEASAEAFRVGAELMPSCSRKSFPKQAREKLKGQLQAMGAVGIK